MTSSASQSLVGTISVSRPTNPAKISNRLPSINMGSDPRTRYYAKLGIFPPSQRPQPEKRPRPSKAVAPPCAPAPKSPSILRRKGSTTTGTAPAPKQQSRVSWNPSVKLYKIPSIEDYSHEEWNNMWIDQETLDYEKDRNTFEFTYDGADWRNATEEDSFQEVAEGVQVHPATWLAYRHHWEKYGSVAPRAVNFRALIGRARSAKPSWSPRPVKQRKSAFWLFDLALESVQKGKNAVNHQRATPSQGVANQFKPHRADRGYP